MLIENVIYLHVSRAVISVNGLFDGLSMEIVASGL